MKRKVEREREKGEMGRERLKEEVERVREAKGRWGESETGEMGGSKQTANNVPNLANKHTTVCTGR